MGQIVKAGIYKGEHQLVDKGAFAWVWLLGQAASAKVAESNLANVEA